MTQLKQYPSAEAVVADLRPEMPVQCWQPAATQAAVREFLDYFPGTTMYAVKSNPHPWLLKQLYQAGIRHFDTASLNEIKLISGMFPDAHCYFMHPVKARSAIREAFHDYGVRDFVVDHMDEWHKLQQEIDVAAITTYVRIAPPSTTAVFDFSKKFGCDIDDAAALLKEIAAAGSKPAVSFHIGSQCLTPNTFSRTLITVSKAVQQSGIKLIALDVGGGFPAPYRDIVMLPMREFFAAITQGIKDAGIPQDIPLLCEPGRALSAHAMSVIVQVQLRKNNVIYINDGMYTNFAEVVLGKFSVPPRLVRLDGAASNNNIDYIVYGPTCDSVDVLPIMFRLPQDLREGDWIEVGLLGAYSLAASTTFNGFHSDVFVEINAAASSAA